MITPNKRVYFDLETGGLDPERDAIIQIAMYCQFTDKSLELKIKFKVENASPEALKINSYDPEVWEREAIHPMEAVQQISKFFKDHAYVEKMSKKGKPYRVAQLCAYNGKHFDGPFLQSWFKRLGSFLPASYKVLDPLGMAEFCLPQLESHRQEVVAEYFGIDTEGAHDALNDVNALVQVTERLEAMIINPLYQETVGDE